MTPQWPEAEVKCSFCGKSESDAERLFAGPRAYICDECVRLLYDVLTEDPKRPPHTA